MASICLGLNVINEFWSTKNMPVGTIIINLAIS